MGVRLSALRDARRSSSVGHKAAALARLARAGYPIPPAWVVPSRLIARVNGDPSALDKALARVLDPSASYAVRSSANVEDGKHHSFAGRFRTLLDVPASDVADAVLEVARIGEDAAALDAYTAAAGLEDTGFAVSVLVQQMVDPSAAGVAFSRNPVTGVRETVIEATAGSGERLMSGRVAAQRWVRKRQEWLLAPDEPVIPLEVAVSIADGAEAIEKRFGHPVDVEWAWDGTLWWLQARPITTGTDVAVYSNKMARDMLPGIILPLVWSINGPLKSEVFLNFLEDVFGPLDVRAQDLSALFHYRMYINIGALSRLFAEFGLPEESLEILAGMEKGAGMPSMPRPTLRALARVPRLAFALRRFTRFDRELEEQLPQLWERSRRFAERGAGQTLSAADALNRIERLEDIVRAVTYGHLVTLMLMQMYSLRLRGQLERAGLLEPGETLQLPRKAGLGYDVAEELDAIASLTRVQPTAVVDLVRAGDLEALRELPAASAFLRAFDAFLDTFGHLSDSGVNLASVPWCEQPECVLAMVSSMLDSPPVRITAISDLEERIGRRRRLRKALNRALDFQALRDQTSSLYTFTYGQFRPHALALGRVLSARSALEKADDVFYLTLDEIRRAVGNALTPEETRAIVEQRTEEVALASEGEPPEVVVGEIAELIRMPRRRILRGVASSRGRYTGRVVLCRGIADLSRISQGDVVVVPFSDASWTALFTRAGAIVAESGGLLSHSAILARELGVPAVVSVRGALALDDGVLVSVDGFEGTVTVLDAAS